MNQILENRAGESSVRLRLRKRTRCPHCWTQFAPEDCNWVSAHADLLGDVRLGSDEQLRFLPSRFDTDGKAIDQKGLSCSEIACPHCHLQVPRAIVEIKPIFVSIAGTPSCGKSYFMASMTWQLRRTMPGVFDLGFVDADTLCNQILNDYEEQQFFNPDQDKIIKLAKTEEQGDLYSQVQYENQTVTYPRPFLFSIRPDENHPAFKMESRASRVLCLYDNAGESFQAGKDTVTSAVTRHLAAAESWMFCFDPTQDPRIRDACAANSNDTQIANSPVTARQETVFHEMASRIRKHSNMGETGRTDRPLIILCTKYDAWWQLLGEQRLPDPYKKSKSGPVLDMNAIRKVSEQVKTLLGEYSTELVSAATSFSTNCFFLPVSATGVGPERDPENGFLGIRPRNMNPMWCDVPMLVVLAERARMLLPRVKDDVRIQARQSKDGSTGKRKS